MTVFSSDAKADAAERAAKAARERSNLSGFFARQTENLRPARSDSSTAATTNESVRNYPLNGAFGSNLR